MDDLKSTESVPFDAGEGTKKPPLKMICVKVYLREVEFIEWVKLAEDAGIRPRGLKPFVLKPHGFARERVANTKGLVKFIKNRIIPYWKDGAVERKLKEEQIRQEADKLGLEVKKRS